MEVTDERPRTCADDLWGPGMRAGLQEGRAGSVGPGPPLANPKLETAHVSINRKTELQAEVYLPNEIPRSNELQLHNGVGESHKNC